MITNNEISNDYIKKYYKSDGSNIEFFNKMNTSSDYEQNNESLVYSDSGYLTNYNHDTQSLSTNSSGVSTEDLYSQAKPIDAVESVYFCENAVFDEPKLEGPPILSEDISINFNQYLDKDNENETLLSVIESTNYILNNSESESSNLGKKSRECTKISEDRSKIFKESLECIKTFKECTKLPEELRKCTKVSEESGRKTFREIRERSKTFHELQRSTKTFHELQGPTKTFHELRGCAKKSEESRTRVYESANPRGDSRECLNFQKLRPEESSPPFVPSNSTIIENSCSTSKHDDVYFDKLSNTKSESFDCSNCSHTLIPSTPNKPIVNSVNPDLSPDLFSDDENDLNITPEIPIINLNVIPRTQRPVVHNEAMLKNDRKLLRRVQQALSGVPPPPSVTILQITVADMLNKINGNKHLFVDNETKRDDMKSLLIVNNREDVENESWPDIINCRYHGLHFNRTKVSEDFEHYCTKYASRYIGVETASSCTIWSTNFPNSATKKKNARLRWGIKSPGRRLSHLARRRITFSSSNLQASCSAASMSIVGSTNVTSKLMIDTRKNGSKRKSPKQKSPLKKLNKTPNSSSKKAARKLNLNDDEPKPSTSRVVSTKRALFQSPESTRSTTSSASTDNPIRGKSRRSLFISPKKQSPAKTRNSPFKSNICDNRKRKRSDEECHPNKFPRSLSFDVHHSSQSIGGSTLTRRHSEMSVGSTSSTKGDMSDLHKKKLLWAVSESLRSQQIGMQHPNFKQYAHMLCKIVKNLMPDLFGGPRQVGSTSERMLRIARQHVFAVTRGKTYNDIMQQIKEQNENLKNLKPIGYVPPESFKSDEKIKTVLQDKVMNIECNQPRNTIKSPEYILGRDENNKARIKRQIIFDDVDNTRNLNTNR